MTELFRNTLGPAAWTMIALVPPAIFALYFLRLRRQPLEVPSTYLWTKVIEDLHVNSLWQKLRRNLLLLLQLLLVGLAILALLRPGWQGEALTGRRFIFLIDRSASMATTDVAGATRLDAAKQRVAALVDQLGSGMSAMIIAFDDDADVAQEFTDNQRLLRDALGRIEATAARTNIRGALELASGFANPDRRADAENADDEAAPPVSADAIELYIFSDGRFDAVENVSLANLHAKYLPIGALDTNNLAITAFNTRRNEVRPEQRQAFVQVANFGDAEQTASVSLFLDGKLLDAAEVKIPPGDVGGATFQLGNAGSGKLEARIAPAPQVADRLALDDRGYAVLDRQQQARVLLVTPGNRPLELGLGTARVRRLGVVETVKPEVIGTPEFQHSMQSQRYDLVIFDQCAPATAEQMPLANTLFVGRLPPLASWRAESAAPVATPDSAAPAASATSPPALAPPPAPVLDPQIIDWQRSHPLLTLVELGNVRMVDSLIVSPPPGGTVLIDSTKGPLMAIAPRESYEDAVLGFEIVGRDATGATTVNTKWPLRLSFPNFCLNVMQYLAGGAAELQLQSTQPGETIEIDLAQAARRLTVVLPDQTTREVEAPAVGKLAFHDTEQLGVYEVINHDAPAGEQLAGRFAINLFDRQESDVRLRARQDEAGGVQTVQSLSIGYDNVAAESPSAPVRKELWSWLLLAALATLVLEWYIYNRRVYV